MFCPVQEAMIAVNYEKFLAARFDFVLRYYLLEKAKFNSREARALIIMNSRYEYLRRVFAELLASDVGDKRVAKFLNKARVLSDARLYGMYYADQLFIDYNDRRFQALPFHDWLWIESQMMKGEEWIKENPFCIAVNGLALSTKRFVLALAYDRTLYWRIIEVKRATLNIWKEIRYKELLDLDRYNELEESKDRMLRRMEKLNFFSIDTYVGDGRLLEVVNEEQRKRSRMLPEREEIESWLNWLN